MKRRTFIFVVIISLATTFSCKDVLNQTPLDKISDDEVWQDPTLIEGYVIELYSDFPSFAYVDFYQYSDEGTVSGGNANAVTLGTVSEDDIPSDLEYWDYEYIRDCNIFLNRISETPINEDLKSKLEGEVRVMRAVAYFEMAKRYGGVPLIENVIDPYEIDEEGLDDQLEKRNKEVEIYDFVNSELSTAIELLENTLDKTPMARINKWAALGFQARVNIWAASIAKYGSEQLNGLVGVPLSRADEFYQNASDAATKVIDSGVYSLYDENPDQATNYQNIFLDEGNSEIIFSKKYNGTEIAHDWDHWKAPPRWASGQGARCDPNLDFILRYENVDGSQENYTQYFNANHLYEDGWDIFKNKDPRLLATVLFQGVDFVDDEIKTYEGIDTTSNQADPSNIINNPNQNFQGISQVGIDSRLVVGDDKTTNSGFLVRKFLDEPNLPVPAEQSQVDWPILRLAELYITKAEAEFELNNRVAAAEALNYTRSRAGISEVDGNSIDVEKIRTEWMAEYAFENKRYWDLRRWRIAEDVLNDKMQGLRIIWHYSSDKYYFLPLDSEPFQRVFQQRNYYNPISASKINNNPLLEQNPLY